TLKLDSHRVELLAHTLLPDALPGHDEGATHVTVFEEPLTVFHPEPLRDLHCTRTGRIGDGHHHIDVSARDFPLDFFREHIPQTQSGIVDRNTAEHRVRPR